MARKAVAVPGVPVTGEPSRGEPQQLGGEVPRADPREDEEAGVVRDEVEAGFALTRGPSDEVVARRVMATFRGTAPTYRPPALVFSPF